MIPEQTLVEFPEFADNGQRTQPEAAKYSGGFLPDDTLPAQYANWLFNKASAGITEINKGLESIEAELVAILTAAGITPSEATNDQVKTAVQQLINSAASTAETNAKNLANATGTLDVSHGGTGQTSVDTAPTANSSKMVTSGGVKSAIDTAESNAKDLANATGTLAIGKGGTGATSASGARTNLGVPPTSHASTGTSYGVASADNYGHAKASSTTPKAAGTAAVGTETGTFARGDHVHPLQTTVSGNAGSATQLATARKLKVALGSTTDKTFNGTADVTDIPIGGTLGIANGGTGQTTAAGVRNALGLGNTTGALPIANGGTGATTAAGIRNAIGLGNTTGALPVANGGTGKTTALTKSDVGLDKVRNEAFPIPVGFIYTQYPGELSPSDLNFPGTWTDITKKFAGLFFRADGGNAKGFDTCLYKVSSQGTKTVTLTAATGIAAGDTVVLINDNDHSKDLTATVSTVNGNTLNFTVNVPSNLTTVLITQSDANKSHAHSYTDPGHEHAINVGATRIEYKGTARTPGSGTDIGFWGGGNTTNTRAYSGTTNITINSSGDTEARPVNTSVRIWKRTA